MNHSLCEEEALCNKVGTAGARLCLRNIGAPTEGGICFRVVAPCQGASCLHFWKPAGDTTEVRNTWMMCYMQLGVAISWGLQSAWDCKQLGTVYVTCTQGTSARQGRTQGTDAQRHTCSHCMYHICAQERFSQGGYALSK